MVVFVLDGGYCRERLSQRSFCSEWHASPGPINNQTMTYLHRADPERITCVAAALRLFVSNWRRQIRAHGRSVVFFSRVEGVLRERRQQSVVEQAVVGQAGRRAMDRVITRTSERQRVGGQQTSWSSRENSPDAPPPRTEYQPATDDGRKSPSYKNRHFQPRRTQ